MVQNHWMEKCSKATQGCEAGAVFFDGSLQIPQQSESFLGIIYHCHFQQALFRDHHPLVGMASKPFMDLIVIAPFVSICVLQTKARGIFFGIFPTGFVFQKKKQEWQVKTEEIKQKRGEHADPDAWKRRKNSLRSGGVGSWWNPIVLQVFFCWLLKNRKDHIQDIKKINHSIIQSLYRCSLYIYKIL